MTYNRQSQHSPPDDIHLPLHIKNVPRCDWPSLLLLVTDDDQKQRLTSLIAICTSPSTFMRQTVPKPRQASLTEDDVAKLVAAGYVAQIPFDTATKSTVDVFTTTEHASNGRRRRVIFWPTEVNFSLTWTGEPVFPTVEEQLEAIAESGAELLDAPAFYTQFTGSADEGEFCFYHGPRKYRCLTVATGQRQVPALAQQILSILTQGDTHAAPEVTHVTRYIDNVRFAGEKGTAELRSRRFRDRAETAGFAFDVTSEWSENYTFLGISYDHKLKHVRLGEKAVQKLTKWLQRLNHDWTTWSLQTFLSLLGLLVWGARVLDIPLANYYWVFKYLRRRARKCHSHKDLDENANIWPSIIRPLQQWTSSCSTTIRPMAPWLLRREHAHTAVVYTDACLHLP